MFNISGEVASSPTKTITPSKLIIISDKNLGNDFFMVRVLFVNILFFILPLFTLACTDEEIEGPAQPGITKELPKVFITTPDETNIVSKEEWVKDGNIVILDEYGNVAIDMQADFKGRGNSTWLLPKKPYAIKLESKAEVLSMPEHKGKLAIFGGMNNVKFKGKVVPGDVLMLEVEITKQKGPIGVGNGKAYVNGKLVTSAELTFVVQ